jgi:queuine/archaeosine tRNA-ribosyltransferase
MAMAILVEMLEWKRVNLEEKIPLHPVPLGKPMNLLYSVDLSWSRITLG